MPPQIAEFAPATRVTSRNDGPVAGSRSPSADSTRAACATSTLASTCGRWETEAITTSCVSGSIADGHAPSRVMHAVQPLVGGALRGRRRRQVPGGVGEQVGARVLDARGLGARQRVAADEARIVDRAHHRALDRADVGDHAVRPGRREHLARRSSASTVHRRGDERRSPRPRPPPSIVSNGLERPPRARSPSHAPPPTGRSRSRARRGAGGRRGRSSHRSARPRRRRPSRGGAQNLAGHRRGALDLLEVGRERARRRSAAARRRWPLRGSGAPRR